MVKAIKENGLKIGVRNYIGAEPPLYSRELEKLRRKTMVKGMEKSLRKVRRNSEEEDELDRLYTYPCFSN